MKHELNIENIKLNKTLFIYFEIFRLKNLEFLFRNIAINQIKQYQLDDSEICKIFIANELTRWSLDEIMKTEYQKEIERAIINMKEYLSESLDILLIQFKEDLLNNTFISYSNILNYVKIMKNVKKKTQLAIKELFAYFEINPKFLQRVNFHFDQIVINFENEIKNFEIKYLKKQFQNLSCFILNSFYEKSILSLQPYEMDDIEDILNKLKENPKTKLKIEKKMKKIQIETDILHGPSKYRFKDITINTFVLKIIQIIKLFISCKDKIKKNRKKLEKYFIFKNCIFVFINSLFHNINYSKFINFCIDEFFEIYFLMQLPEILPPSKKKKINTSHIYREHIKSIGININTLKKRPPSFKSTLFISGYLSQNDSKTDQSWLNLEQFFFKGDMLVAHWNSMESLLKKSNLMNSAPAVISMVTSFACNIYIFIIISSAKLNPIGLFTTVSQVKNGINSQTAKFKSAYENAQKEGMLGYSLIKDNPQYSECLIDIIGFSLGTVFINSFLKAGTYMLQYPLIINNIYLLGGCLKSKDLYKNLRKLLSDDSFFKGTIYIIYSKKDYVLKYLLPLAYPDCEPIGLQEFNYVNARDYLMKKTKKIKHFRLNFETNPNIEDTLLEYLQERIKCVDVTDIVGGHTNYRNKLKEIFSLL